VGVGEAAIDYPELSMRIRFKRCGLLSDLPRNVLPLLCGCVHACSAFIVLQTVDGESEPVRQQITDETDFQCLLPRQDLSRHKVDSFAARL